MRNTSWPLSFHQAGWRNLPRKTLKLWIFAGSFALGSSQATGAATIENPKWFSHPSVVDIDSEKPPRAYYADVQGSVKLSCISSERGRMDQCSVMSENPSDYGFGKAAIRLSRRYILDKDLWASAKGQNVVFTIPFR